MEFEWDAAKSDATYALRGYDFAVVVGIFAGPAVEAVDDRRDYGEVRVQAIGETAGIALVVVSTDRDGTRRIISARGANRSGAPIEGSARSG